MKKNEMKQRRQFYFLLAGVLLAVAGSKLYHGKTVLGASLATAGLLPLLLEFTVPSVSVILFRRWMKFGEWLGHVNSYVVVAMMFLLILTPVGIVLRILGKYRVYDRESRQKRSSWIPLSDPRPLTARYETPY